MVCHYDTVRDSVISQATTDNSLPNNDEVKIVDNEILDTVNTDVLKRTNSTQTIINIQPVKKFNSG